LVCCNGKQYELKLTDPYWMSQGEEEREDLCLHGWVKITIGDWKTVVDCTVTAAALFLLRTLEEDWLAGQQENLLFPCCGFGVFFDESAGRVVIVGCPGGEDCTVLHEGDNLRVIPPKGGEEIVPLTVYRKMVMNFVRDVERIYRESPMKFLGKDNLDRRAWQAFREEWNLRSGWVEVTDGEGLEKMCRACGYFHDWELYAMTCNVPNRFCPVLRLWMELMLYPEEIPMEMEFSGDVEIALQRLLNGNYIFGVDVWAEGDRLFWQTSDGDRISAKRIRWRMN